MGLEFQSFQTGLDPKRMELSIDPPLKKVCPALALGLIEASVKVTEKTEDLWKEIRKVAETVPATFLLDSFTGIPEIAAAREVYRKLGKDPTRYRGSAEALIRRILQGKGIYRVNNIVDINNLVSIETRLPMGCYDADKLQPPIVFGVGKKNETYKGIGKEMINLEDLPVFRDHGGPFGSPTSDSERSMIRDGTKRILMVVIAFNGKAGLMDSCVRASALLQQFASAQIHGIKTVG
jgi:DNA/RNA-binding domain of Phe-tRNA-synthetase-like protein